jgi:hypothetical protein
MRLKLLSWTVFHNEWHSDLDLLSPITWGVQYLNRAVILLSFEVYIFTFNLQSPKTFRKFLPIKCKHPRKTQSNVILNVNKKVNPIQQSHPYLLKIIQPLFWNQHWKAHHRASNHYQYLKLDLSSGAWKKIYNHKIKQFKWLLKIGIIAMLKVMIQFKKNW